MELPKKDKDAATCGPLKALCQANIMVSIGNLFATWPKPLAS
jgi:hypothetical protein